MLEDWKTYKLVDLIDVNINSLRKGDVEWINYIDIKSVGTGFYSEPRVLKFVDAPSRARRLLKEGDTVISSVRPNLKSFFYAHNLKENSVASTGFAVLTAKRIDQRFLYYLTTNDNYIEFLVKSCTGSAYPTFSPNVLLQSEVFIPDSLPEQKAIASILSALDDKIELNLQMNKTLEEMAMTLYKHWFVDFGPFQDGEFVDSELGEIPKGWEVKTLESILEIKYGKDHKKLAEGNIPCYGTGGIMRYVDQSLYDEDSILIPRKGSLNNLYYMTKPFWTVDTLFYSKIKKSYFGKYAFHFLKTLDLASMDVGSAIPSLTTQLLKRIKLIIPQFEELEKFDKIVTLQFNTIESNLEENQTLTQLRDTLLPKLISGEVRIKEGVAQIQAVI